MPYIPAFYIPLELENIIFYNSNVLSYIITELTIQNICILLTVAINIAISLIIILIIKKKIKKFYRQRFSKELNKRINLQEELKKATDEKNKFQVKLKDCFQNYTIQKEEHRLLLDEIKTGQEEVLEMYENIKKSEKQYRILAESSQDMIIHLNTEGIIQYSNKALIETIDIKKGQNVFSLLSLYSEEHQKLLLDNFESRKKGNYSKSFYELELKLPNGKKIPIEVSSNPIIENGEFVGILLVIRNIENRINTELELLSKNKRLLENNQILQKLIKDLKKAQEKGEESDRLKTSFLANLSHEIRTPMNGIQGFVSLLNNDNIPRDKQKQYISIIQNSTEQLLRIMSDIIDFSKIEAKEFQLLYTDFNFAQFIEEIKQETILLKEKKKKNNIEISIQNSLPEITQIHFDRNRLKQVLINLADNALKFTDIGTIEISVKMEDDDNFLFQVKDTGIGISKNNLNVIFDRFIQTETSLNRQHGGTGLGLSICKGIVNIGGGKIWIESIENKGTSLFFTIPFSKPE